MEIELARLLVEVHAVVHVGVTVAAPAQVLLHVDAGLARLLEVDLALFALVSKKAVERLSLFVRSEANDDLPELVASVLLDAKGHRRFAVLGVEAGARR